MIHIAMVDDITQKEDITMIIMITTIIQMENTMITGTMTDIMKHISIAINLHANQKAAVSLMATDM